jgi:steroid 5-alpha reductase family enzyme
MFVLFLLNCILLSIPLLLLWIGSLRTRDVSVVDIFWGSGFGLVAFFSLLLCGPSPRGFLVATLVAIWGSRLSMYLYERNHGKPEDSRYQAIRARFGPSFSWKSLYVVFGLQGLLIALVSLPVQAAIFEGGNLGNFERVGTVLWAVGMVFESVGDWQLSKFKADPSNQGRVMNRGLWRYTRHPNYFGDFCIWWGFFLFSMGAGVWWTFVGPLLMSGLLLRVSGVALLEKTIVERRPEYRQNIQETSAFFPWFPRRP